jgi:hypothetical protein
VDIDRTYLPVEDRAASLGAIDTAMLHEGTNRAGIPNAKVNAFALDLRECCHQDDRSGWRCSAVSAGTARHPSLDTGLRHHQTDLSLHFAGDAVARQKSVFREKEDLHSRPL